KELPAQLPDLATKKFTAKVGEDGREFVLYDPAKDGAAPTSVAQLALLLERKIRAAGADKAAFAGAQVRPMGKRVLVVAGDPDATMQLSGPADAGITLQDTANPGAF